MNYYLLEDNFIQQQRIQHIVENCRVFEQPADFLVALKEDLTDKVILLDLEIHTVANAGLTVAKMIRQFDATSPIIIVTTHSEMLEQGLKYHIGILDFINKTQPELLFAKRVQSAVSEAEQQIRIQSGVESDFVALPNGKKTENINLNDIVYATCSESTSHQLTIYCEQKNVQIRATVKSLPKLHPNLMQIHAAYVINKDKVMVFDAKKNAVQLNNGVTLPCARKYIKPMRRLFEVSCNVNTLIFENTSKNHYNKY